MPNFHLAAYKDEDDDFKFKKYKTDLATYKTIKAETSQDNWAAAVQIASIFLIIFSIWKLLYNIIYLPLDGNQTILNQDVLMVVGISNLAMKVVDVVWDILIFVQGVYGVRTARDKNSKVAKLINLALVFFLTHVIAIIIKLIIAAGYIDNYDWNSFDGDEQMTDDEIQNQETFIYGLIIASFFLNCILIWCWCAGLMMLYYMFYQSKTNYEHYRRESQDINPPEPDF